jgi:predicted porin
MKKSIIASAVALSMFAVTAQAADVTVYGQVEEAIVTTGGSSDVVGDNVLGFKASETLENNITGYAKVEFGVDEDAAANADAITTREVYAGVDFGKSLAVQAGKIKNLKKQFANPVDIMQGNSFGINGQGRVDDQVQAFATVGAVKLGVATTLDGQAGSDSVGDTRELAVSYDFGNFSLSAVNTKTGTTGATENVFAAKTKVDNVSLALAYEPDATNKTTTGVASVDVGAQTFRAGYAYVDGGNNTVIGEVAHNFSKRTAAFVNYKKAENADQIVSVGLVHRF